MALYESQRSGAKSNAKTTNAAKGYDYAAMVDYAERYAYAYTYTYTYTNTNSDA